ncbi:MAG: hypothetical protein JW928_04635, partial [Candidatus Aureabacteria bacterium]|nr:hypothetical protein [Candidatus Auribacterota bacterium]
MFKSCNDLNSRSFGWIFHDFHEISRLAPYAKAMDSSRFSFQGKVKRSCSKARNRNKKSFYFFFIILLSFLSTAGNPPGYPLDKDEGCFSKKDLQ